ncbi:MAG: GTP-sensing pleiotropic transcriptional regulator CodY [Peptostreptococcaceae bacterium]|nr:GTP-sensing pleiotropic transcriptional regulator CodY [Peptostreptococcaceae bacterium]
MEKQILAKFRKLNWVLSHSDEGYFSFNDLSDILSEVLEANVYIFSKKGKVLAMSLIDVAVLTEDDSRYNWTNLEDKFNENLSKIKETVINLNRNEASKIFGKDFADTEKYHTIAPAISGEIRVGSLLFVRADKSFTDMDIALCEYSATVVGLEIGRGNVLEFEKIERQKNVVRQALETLSYSELEAVRCIFKELDGDEGLLVASRVADRTGITRSVIVNTLRKLESAGVIESRSLGMKGTRLKIKNKYLSSALDEIN